MVRSSKRKGVIKQTDVELSNNANLTSQDKVKMAMMAAAGACTERLCDDFADTLDPDFIAKLAEDLWAEIVRSPVPREMGLH